MIATLLLAAGASSRMLGRDKLLEPIGGQPLLGRMAERALACGPVYVTLPDLKHKRRFVLPQAAQVVAVAGEMSDSIKAGVNALPHHITGLVILPADMPDIETEDIAAVMDRATQTQALIVRATTQDGLPGHPTYFARALFPAFATLKGDRGANRLLKDHEAETVFLPLNGQRARLDLDTPAEWSAYRNRP